ncbi:hypothetical protein [Paucilactobacillus kaifaensis]|uniref:hypothetical protein n=1 Tax=Paucilactobacillus kaifaensis TaxID=2559921 RepID=UPI0010F4F839|nr:hypothetical protein [Paucilactobacillus kaifaensis]
MGLDNPITKGVADEFWDGNGQPANNKRELADGTSFYEDDWIDGARDYIAKNGLTDFLDLWSERVNK